MSYNVQGQLFNTRTEALTQLVALWVSNNGEQTDMEEIKSALRDSETPTEIISEWSGNLGEFQEPTDEDELANHIQTHKADIIMAC
ncbi:hypothetical protein HW452_16695 [Halomonas aquamarina]|uniref:Uncharacterized protein n=1 Tax=Vreelandella aquamarina TaxID=77097 RepID=A0ACC5VYW8_9GAMM|nr:hypothetical protein [Halomonas aquamarina]MBZ5489160.1 hypothetical protein [Halomonas aquamarina]